MMIHGGSTFAFMHNLDDSHRPVLLKEIWKGGMFIYVTLNYVYEQTLEGAYQLSTTSKTSTPKS